MKLAILSYIGDYQKYTGHGEFDLEHSSFQSFVADSLENAAEFISNRIRWNKESPHLHIIVEDFQSLCNVVQHEPYHARVIEAGGNLKFEPGVILWPSKYSTSDDVSAEELAAADERTNELREKLITLIEADVGEGMKREFAETLRKAKEEMDARLQEQRARKEAQFEQLKKELGK
jgi:hypothetical protein